MNKLHVTANLVECGCKTDTVQLRFKSGKRDWSNMIDLSTLERPGASVADDIYEVIAALWRLRTELQVRAGVYAGSLPIIEEKLSRLSPFAQSIHRELVERGGGQAVNGIELMLDFGYGEREFNAAVENLIEDGLVEYEYDSDGNIPLLRPVGFDVATNISSPALFPQEGKE